MKALHHKERPHFRLGELADFELAGLFGAGDKSDEAIGREDQVLLGSLVAR